MTADRLETSRAPSVAGSFYPADGGEARRAIEGHLAAAAAAAAAGAGIERARVGLVPHAGWVFSGDVAARTFGALAESGGSVRAVVILGAVHRSRVRAPALFGPGEWTTPLGSVRVDEELSRAIADVAVDPRSHDGEHSIEVQIPFVQVLWPEAQIVPVAVTPDARAFEVGERVADAIAARDDVAVIASSDLTHYGPRYDFTPHGLGDDAHRWAKSNDGALLRAALSLDAPRVLRVALETQSACGPGALAAAVVVAHRLGCARGDLLSHTTSHEVRPQREARDFVGYAAMLFR